LSAKLLPTSAAEHLVQVSIFYLSILSIEHVAHTLLHAGVHGRPTLLLGEHSLLGWRLHAWSPVLSSQLLSATTESQQSVFFNSETFMLVKIYIAMSSCL
jgi:hypothetical protein